MATVERKPSPEVPTTDTLLRALVALELDAREQRLQSSGPSSSVRAEVLLSRAGLGISEIALLLNKNYDAVRKVISRAKSGTEEQ